MKYLTDQELKQMFDNYIDEIYEPIQVTIHVYDTSKALKLLDPIAYRQGYLDWLDSVVGETLLYNEKDDQYYLLDEEN